MYYVSGENDDDDDDEILLVFLAVARWLPMSSNVQRYHTYKRPPRVVR